MDKSGPGFIGPKDGIITAKKVFNKFHDDVCKNGFDQVKINTIISVYSQCSTVKARNWLLRYLKYTRRKSGAFFNFLLSTNLNKSPPSFFSLFLHTLYLPSVIFSSLDVPTHIHIS